jgi:hypothetical protein
VCINSYIKGGVTMSEEEVVQAIEEESADEAFEVSEEEEA